MKKGAAYVLISHRRAFVHVRSAVPTLQAGGDAPSVPVVLAEALARVGRTGCGTDPLRARSMAVTNPVRPIRAGRPGSLCATRGSTSRWPSQGSARRGLRYLTQLLTEKDRFRRPGRSQSCWGRIGGLSKADADSERDHEATVSMKCAFGHAHPPVRIVARASNPGEPRARRPRPCGSTRARRARSRSTSRRPSRRARRSRASRPRRPTTRRWSCPTSSSATPASPARPRAARSARATASSPTRRRRPGTSSRSSAASTVLGRIAVRGLGGGEI
jgi:hypothetical protein